MPVRQRRAHRQRRSRHAGHEPLLPGRGPADRLLRHRRHPAHRGVLQPASGARASPVCRRPGLHIVLRLAPGRDQQGLRRPGARRGRGRCAGGGVPLGAAVPPDRPQGRRPVLRGRDPGEQPVRQGRRRVHHEDRKRSRPAAQAADRVLAGVVQEHTDGEGGEVTPEQMWAIFEKEFLTNGPKIGLFSRHRRRLTVWTRGRPQRGRTASTAWEIREIEVDRETARSRRSCNALWPRSVSTPGAPTTPSTPCPRAATRRPRRTSSARWGRGRWWGVGIDANTVTASLKAVLSAVNRAMR